MVSIPPDLAAAYQRCEALAKERLENFPVLSEHLSPEHSHHLAAVYAFCRNADDAADETSNPQQALEKLAALGAEVEDAFAGRAPKTLEMRALAHTIRERGLSKPPFLDLLDAFRQDQRKTRHENWESLLDYSRRSANPVGRLVLETVGELSNPRSVGEANDRARKLELSDRICTGLQLANFWQDVGPDFAKGRIYLPADAMARHGVDEATLAARQATPAFRALLSELCDRTRPLFAEGCALSDLVEKRLRIPILAFSIAGDELLRRIAAASYDVFGARPQIGDLPLKKILAKAAAARWIPALRPRA
jgi:squalene synthase HpnC